MQYGAKLYGIILFAAVLLFSPSALAGTLDFSFQNKSFFHNLEYVGIDYKEGETFFGDHLTMKTTYKPVETLSYTGGIFLGKVYGSEKSLEPVKPVLTFHYQPDDDFAFTFGNLDTGGHTFWDSMFDDVLRYTRPLESGFELFGAKGKVEGRAWINWQQLNTPEHREKFDVGSIVKLDLSPVLIDLQGHVVHRGGQLYSSGPVGENFTAGIGATYLLPVLDGTSIAGRGLYSNDVPDRSNPSLSREGGGGEVEVQTEFSKWRVICSAWFGDDFYAEDGDPFYRADSFMRLGLDKTFEITKKAKIIAAATVYYVDDIITHSAKIMITYGEDFNLIRRGSE